MISVLQQILEVAGVTDITVTDPEFDPDAGIYIREIRVTVNDEGIPAMVLRVSGDALDDVQVSAPEQRF